MRRRRYTAEQIASALGRAQSGAPASQVCRDLGVAEATFYRWKKRLAGAAVFEDARLRRLEAENSALRRLLGVDATADHDSGPGPGRDVVA